MRVLSVSDQSLLHLEWLHVHIFLPAKIPLTLFIEILSLPIQMLLFIISLLTDLLSLHHVYLLFLLLLPPHPGIMTPPLDHLRPFRYYRSARNLFHLVLLELVHSLLLASLSLPHLPLLRLDPGVQTRTYTVKLTEAGVLQDLVIFRGECGLSSVGGHVFQALLNTKRV